jgi:hypothetical protein
MTELEDLLQRLKLEIQVSGVGNVDAAFKSLKKSIIDGTISLDALKAKYGNLEKAAKSLANEYKKTNEESRKAATSIKQATIRAIDSFLGLGNAIREAISALKSMVIPSSFKEAVKLAIEYDRNILMAAASVNRLGVGLTELEDVLRRTGSTIGFTREETFKLFNQFQTSMKFTSILEFENILKRIKSMVGANAAAAGQYQSAISQISQEYPMLGKALANIDNEDKKNIESKVTMLLLMGKIGDAEYQMITAYIRGNKQVTAVDLMRQKYAQKNIQTQQEYNRQVEKASLIYGRVILPVLAKVGGWVEQLLNGTKKAKAEIAETEREMAEATALEEKEKEEIARTDELANKKQALILLEATRVKYVEDLSEKTKTQLGLVTSLVEKASISGEIGPMDGIAEATELGLKNLDEQIAGQEKYLSKLKEEYTQKIANGELDRGDVQSLNKISQVQTDINNKIKQQTEFLLQQANKYNDQLNYLRASADQVGTLVQLMDNYAIGVGASAEKRMEAFQAEENYIQVQKKQLAIQRNALEGVEKNGTKNYILRAKVKELETGILNSQLKQASLVKSLRDNWVSAISAMNTGADSFAEIVMNTEQNTAQVMRLGGAVRSAYSGAFAARGAAGKVTETVGFATSEKMNQFGTISSLEGRGGMAVPYMTPTEARLRGMGVQGGYRGPEFGERAEMFRGAGIQEQSRATAAGGLAALAAGASPMAAAPIIAGEGLTGSYGTYSGNSPSSSFSSGMNITVKFENITQFAKELANKISDNVEERSRHSLNTGTPYITTR